LPRTASRGPWLLAVAVALTGTAAAVHYANAGLSVSHYDARAHLVVARRVFDSLFPGWQQIGGVWLPLPHLLNMIPVQVDAWYRTGASAIAISILSMATAAWALASLLIRLTGSRVAAVAGAALLLANPNLLYLQSTPMTEPLLFGTTLLAAAWTAEWLDRDPPAGWMKPGVALAAACLTRYEALPISAAIVGLACAVLLRRGAPGPVVLRSAVGLAAPPFLALVLFTLNSRWTMGIWFIPSDFYVAENVEALGRPLEAWRQVRVGLYRLSGSALVWTAYLGLALTAIAFVRSKARAPLVLVAALAAAALLPWYAYVQGHPFRIRYDVPLVVAASALAACAIALLPALLRPLAAGAVVALALVQAPPLDPAAPVVVESRRDARNMAGRRTVTAYLTEHYDGTGILASMGSLAHYMHDLSHAGFHIHDFLHEGNGELWPCALDGARGLVGWVLIEERAEGGDALFHHAKREPRFLSRFERVSEGGGVALYRRQPQRPNTEVTETPHHLSSGDLGRSSEP
jgi:hypothetical protein